MGAHLKCLKKSIKVYVVGNHLNCLNLSEDNSNEYQQYTYLKLTKIYGCNLILNYEMLECVLIGVCEVIRLNTIVVIPKIWERPEQIM